MYINGLGGLEKDYKKAAVWLHKAAELDFELAQETLQMLYDRGLVDPVK